MSKILLLFIFITCLVKVSYSQDIITLKNGEEIISKVLNIGPNDVTFKKFDNLNGPSYTILKTNIFFIKYENGIKDIFNEIELADNKAAITSENLFMEGTKDATLHYPIRYTGAGWTLANSILLSPIGGLVTAVLCSSVKPNNGNLDVPYKEKMSNLSYLDAYRNTAHKMKKKKIWTNFGIGSGAYLALILINNSK